MKQISIRALFILAVTTVLLLSGCTKEMHNEGLGEGTYLSLSIDGQQSPTAAASATSAAVSQRGASTRATVVDESAVNDLWVLQFKMTTGSTTDGTLVNKTYITSISDLTKVKYMYVIGDNMALYLVANTGNSSLFSSTADGTTLAVVKAITGNVNTTTGSNFPADTSANLPMVGQSATLKLPTTTDVPVTLIRTVAKIVLTIKNPLETGYPQLTVTSVQLKKTPTSYATQVVNATNGFTGTNYYPSAAASNFNNYTATTGNITAAGTTTTYYIAPNIRGIGTNTDDRLKSEATAPSGQGSFCTYVEIFGTAKATASSPAVDVRYRLYLGGNNTNDFNLLSNTAYKVDVELTGINGNDARMRITTDKFDLIQGGTDGDHEDDIVGFAPAVGDYYYTDGSYSSKIESGKTVNGLIYYVDATDPTKYKVFSWDQGSSLKWSASYSYVLGSAGRSNTNGKANVAAMKAYSTAPATGVFATDFPAAAFCEAKNTGGVTGWYLPASDELMALYTAYTANKKVLDDAITASRGTAMVSDRLWSSTESTFNGDASCVSFSIGTTTRFYKSNTTFVRCVRDL